MADQLSAALRQEYMSDPGPGAPEVAADNAHYVYLCPTCARCTECRRTKAPDRRAPHPLTHCDRSYCAACGFPVDQEATPIARQDAVALVTLASGRVVLPGQP